MLDPWPDWFEGLFPNQQQVVSEIVAHFQSGKRWVFLDAPTGSGKTIIAEAVRRELNGNGVFVCSTKTLQQQVLADFPYARLLQGRANYETHKPPATCDECDWTKERGKCSFCPTLLSCPYRQAKHEALTSDLAILNTSYLFHAMTYAGTFTDRDLHIIDEGDLVPDMLCDFAGIVIPGRLMKELRINPPSNVSDVKKLNELLPKWAEKTSKQFENYGEGLDQDKDKKTYQQVTNITHKLRIVSNSPDVLWIIEGVKRSNRQSHPTLILKAVNSAPVAHALTAHVSRGLLMSATLISGELMARDLGLERGEWASVEMESTFPAYHRPIVAPPLPTLTAKRLAEGIPQETQGQLNRILSAHQDERVLIHVPSYKLAQELQGQISDSYVYRNAHERESVIARWLDSESGVLIAPSLKRGLDLKGDLCRVQIIFKLPIPNIGSPQVAARLYGPGGNDWMALATIREFVQAVGRVVRGSDDYGVTYVLDGKLAELFRSHGRLIPKWIKKAIAVNRSREAMLLNPYPGKVANVLV